MTEKSPILVPLDFSPECRLILEFAEREAQRSSGNLLLLHVAQFRDPVQQRRPHLLTDPLDDCARALTRIHPSRVAVLMLRGEPIEGILSVAQEHNCPIIIMGRGGTPERPGHVALAVQQKFPGKIHSISRFHIETPMVP